MEAGREARPAPWLVRASLVAFGFSSWAILNSVWLELPELYARVPEGYALATYLLASLALTNGVPLALAALPAEKRQRLPLQLLILCVVGASAALCLLLGLFWPYTMHFAGAPRSVALLTLVACAGVANNTSTVLFWPWVGRQAAPYTQWLGVGEGVSGLLPGLLAVVQGSGSGRARFGPSVFFYVMAALNGVSFVAFVLLWRWETKGFLAGREGRDSGRVEGGDALIGSGVVRKSPDSEDRLSGPSANPGGNHGGGICDVGSGDEQPSRVLDTAPLLRCEDESEHEIWTAERDASPDDAGRRSVVLVCATQCWFALWQFGIIQSVNSYATSGYPHAGSVLLWCTVACFTMDPVGRVCVGLPRLGMSRVPHLAAPVSLFTMAASFVLAAAALSPDPPLRSVPGGALAVILANGVSAGLFGFVNTGIYAIGRHLGIDAAAQEDFNWSASAALQLGSIIGAGFSLLFVVALQLFRVPEDRDGGPS